MINGALKTRWSLTMPRFGLTTERLARRARSESPSLMKHIEHKLSLQQRSSFVKELQRSLSDDERSCTPARSRWPVLGTNVLADARIMRGTDRGGVPASRYFSAVGAGLAWQHCTRPWSGGVDVPQYMDAVNETASDGNGRLSFLRSLERFGLISVLCRRSLENGTKKMV